MPVETKYAKSGDIHIAYQVVGQGPIDLVLLMGGVSHLEYGLGGFDLDTLSRTGSRLVERRCNDVELGNRETTTGGRALKFYASVRLDIRRIDSVKMGTDVVGSHVNVKVVKNKVAAPFRVAEFDIMYKAGISKEGSLIDLGVEVGSGQKW
jgi:hypothetical protein